MPRINLQDIDLYFESYGKGRAVIFVHGSGGNHLSWWQQIPELSRQYRCIVFDQRTFGFTFQILPGRDHKVLRDDLCAVLDHLDISKAYFVGQSIGGRTCLTFALSDPERVDGLVLADTLAGIVDDRIEMALAAAPAIPDNLIERALSPQFRAQKPNLAHLYLAIENVNRLANNSKMIVPPHVTAEQLNTLRCPTLFIVGDRDPVAPLEAVKVAASMIPGAKIEIIANSGHSAYFEQPEAFNRALASFFETLI